MSEFETKSSYSSLGATLWDSLSSRLDQDFDRTGARSSAWLLKRGSAGFIGAFLMEPNPGYAASLGVAELHLMLFSDFPLVEEMFARLEFAEGPLSVSGVFSSGTGPVQSLEDLNVSDEASAMKAEEACVSHLTSVREKLTEIDLETAGGLLQLLETGGIRLPHQVRVIAEALLKTEEGQIKGARNVLEAELALLEQSEEMPFQMKVSPEMAKLMGSNSKPMPALGPDPRTEMFRAWIRSLDS